jgi:hypothetical protein
MVFAARQSQREVVLDVFKENVESVELTEANLEVYIDLTCSICISDLSEGDLVYKLSCGHYFH